MTAETLARALGGRRCGRNWIARCPAHEDKTPSLSVRDADGETVLVHCFGGCSQSVVIETLQDRGLWVRPARHEYTAAERVAWARQRRADERDQQSARWFAIAAKTLAETALESLDVADPEREFWTALLRALRSDAGRLAEYRAWGPRRRLVRALVGAGRAADEAGQVRAAAWLLARWDAAA